MDDPLRDPKERALIEGQKAFIIINAVGAVVLLAFLQAIWPQAGATALKKGVLNGIVAFSLGVMVAMLGYVARDWLARAKQSSPGRIFRMLRVGIPAVVTVCFLAGVILPVLGGHESLSSSLPGQAAKRR